MEEKDMSTNLEFVDSYLDKCCSYKGICYRKNEQGPSKFSKQLAQSHLKNGLGFDLNKHDEKDDEIDYHAMFYDIFKLVVMVEFNSKRR